MCSLKPIKISLQPLEMIQLINIPLLWRFYDKLVFSVSLFGRDAIKEMPKINLGGLYDFVSWRQRFWSDN